MMKHTIITIGRQVGSGGHEVGNRLAERLDIPLYQIVKGDRAVF